MWDGQAGLGYPPWKGGLGGSPVCKSGGREGFRGF